MHRWFTLLILLVFQQYSKAEDSTLVLKKIITGGLSPKSVVHSGNGLFFAQNMMYRHTISVYSRDYSLVKTIKDNINPKDFGIDTISGFLMGSPVEAAFSNNGKYAWVSNYNMTGDKFENPGCDGCSANNYDKSFLYKINTESLLVEKIIYVGSVPKYVAVSPDDKYVLTSNWSSGDISVVDVEKNKEVKRIRAGRFPRGIVVDSKSRYAYVTIMGASHILKIDLEDFSTSKIENVGRAPRHLCISSDDSVLYVSLNNEGKIAKINLNNYSIEKISCSGAPRSMIMTPDDKFLYVVNYSINKFSKIDLRKFEVVEQRETKDNPIGIAFDDETKEVWVACYSGSLMVYEDIYYREQKNWLADFDVSDQVNFVFDFVGKVSETVLLASNVSQTDQTTQTPNSKPETRNPKPETVTLSGAEGSKPGTIFIIVGSFSVESNAINFSKKLKSKGYQATTFKNKKGMTYTAIGGYNDEQIANENLKKVRSAEGIDAWIYRL